MDPDNPFPETVLHQFPTTMHKMQDGKLISGPIINLGHYQSARANGWFLTAEEAKAAVKPPEVKAAPAPATVEERLAALERWVTEQRGNG